MTPGITLRARKPIVGGKGAVQEVDDYDLSRFACYLIAQIGDPLEKRLKSAKPKLELDGKDAAGLIGTNNEPANG